MTPDQILMIAAIIGFGLSGFVSFVLANAIYKTFKEMFFWSAFSTSFILVVMGSFCLYITLSILVMFVSSIT